MFFPVVLLSWTFFEKKVAPYAQYESPVASINSFSPVLSRKSLKPIFHCDAKYLASGVLGNAPDTRILRHLTENILTCWYILALPNAKTCITPDAKPRNRLPPTPTPDASQWNIGGVGPSGVRAGVGHVHFMLFMSKWPCLISGDLSLDFYQVLHYFVLVTVLFFSVLYSLSICLTAPGISSGKKLDRTLCSESKYSLSSMTRVKAISSDKSLGRVCNV